MANRFPSEDVYEKIEGRDQGAPRARELLVTGCPRSGTRYLTKALRRLGMGVKHEGMSVHGAVSCFLAFEDYWYPGGFHGGRRSSYEFGQVWHLVRHPLKAIASMATPGHLSGEFLHWQEKHTRIEGDLLPKLERMAEIWHCFVRYCEYQATWTLQIERVEELWPEIMDRVGRTSERDILGSIDRTLGRRTTPTPLAWSDLEDWCTPELTERLRDMAQKLGYDTEETA